MNKSSWGCADKEHNFLQQGNVQLAQVLKHATTFKHKESGQGLLGAQIDEELGLEPPLKEFKAR
jgi:hypothetical protein